MPDQQERFYALMRAGSDWVGNPHLSPSRNTGGEGEVRYSGHGIDAGFSGFVYRVDDHILVVDQPRREMLPGIMNAAARSYANVDALMRGVEASGTLPLARTVFASGDLSVVRGTRRGPGGGDLPEIPPARVRLRVRFDNARWNGLAEIVGAARQNHVAPELRETPTAAFLSVNLRGGWRLRGFSVAAALDNVCDTRYAEHLSYQRDPFRNGVRVYEPGRTISFNVGARF
jgi:iron complex outermembrane receptor protein